MAYKKWTDEDDELIIQCRDEGLTNQEIADRVGLTVNSIKQRCSKLIKEGKLEKKVRGAVARKLKYGKEDLAMLVEKYGTTENYNKHMKEDGLPPINWIIQKWGSWTEARNALGLPENTGVFEGETILYCLYFPEEDFYKVGITQRSIKDRFYRYPEYEIVSETIMPTKASAKEAEKTLFIGKPYEPLHPMFHKKTGGGAGGKTECFRL